VKVLLTGANGFIGSHILDLLLQHGFDVACLLRKTSDTRFIEPCLPRVEVRYGSLDSPESLREAARGVDAVIHCAGRTKAVRKREFYEVNAEGTRNVVAACNASADSVRHLIYISTLSVSGPGSTESPAREDAPPRPVSAYGRSKHLAEDHVRRDCRVPYTIFRPAAVYGPRDRDLFVAFKTVHDGVLLLIRGGKQLVSFVYVTDVAEAVLKAIGCAGAYGNTYHLAHPVPWSQRAFLSKIADAMGAKPRPVVVPVPVLYPAALLWSVWSWATKRPRMLSLSKLPELTAPGWVCTTAQAAADLGFVAGIPLDEGVRLTLDWYRTNGWLPTA
jgi:nucleoside-diphosphate-sugar epimerase